MFLLWPHFIIISTRSFANSTTFPTISTYALKRYTHCSFCFPKHFILSPHAHLLIIFLVITKNIKLHVCSLQISDIVIGQEPNVSAKDYLLRWAKRTTHKYPGVNVQDFTKSWRDGLAFSSIIHRNRPDLVDFRQARSQRPRERMEHAFYIAEKEYGVTRLLDPEGKNFWRCFTSNIWRYSRFFYVYY